MHIKVLGIDLAKNVFQLCAINQAGKEVFNRQVRRAKLASTVSNLDPDFIAMEACSSAHYWGRRFEAMGHQVALIPAQHVKAFVRVNKSDAHDALAIADGQSASQSQDRAGQVARATGPADDQPAAPALDSTPNSGRQPDPFNRSRVWGLDSARLSGMSRARTSPASPRQLGHLIRVRSCSRNPFQEPAHREFTLTRLGLEFAGSTSPVVYQAGRNAPP